MKKVILFLCVSFVYTFATAQKQVLFEKFTNAFCGVCPDATLNLKDIVAEYPDAIWISHHKPVTWTDNPLTNERSIAIWNELNVAGVPNGMVDRTQYNNSITMSRSQWKERIINHLDFPTSFDVEIAAIDFDANTRSLTFDVNTKVIEDAPLGPYHITAYIVEDSVTSMHQNSYFNDVPGHPLEGRGDIIWDYYHRNVVRTILEDHWGVADVIPNEPLIGETYTHTFNYVVPDEYKPRRMKIVAMVAQFDEVNNYPGVVHDAAQVDFRDANLILSDTKDISTQQIEIIPNPATDYLTVTFKEVPNLIQVYDQSGQLKLNIIPSQLPLNIDVTSLTSGTYFLVVDKGGKLNGQIFSKV